MSKTIIEHDLLGAVLSQSFMDKVFAQAVSGGSGGCDIIIRNVATTSFPRLVVDYGELYETLCMVAKEYRAYRAATENTA